MANKSEVLNDTVVALAVASVVTAIGMFFNYNMSMVTVIVGMLISIGCIFGIHFVDSVVVRKLMLWFVPSFMGLSLSSQLMATGAGAIVTAAVATMLLVSLASVIYSRFSMTSLAIFSIVGVIGLIILMLCGFTGTWMSLLGVVIFFACIMYDFAMIEYSKTSEAAAMGLVISVVNMFNSIRKLVG